MLTRATRISASTARYIYPLGRAQLGGIRSVSGAQTVPVAETPESGKKYLPPVTLDREFPDPFAQQKQNRKYFVVYGIGVTLACALIFNYEKTRSPITTSSLFFLRRSETAKKELGTGIDFNSSWPWISGTLNTVKGDVDIEFKVKGQKSVGTLKLKATRDSKTQPFNVHHFLLEVGGTEYDLLKDPSVQFDL